MTETTQLQKIGILMIRPTIAEMSEMALRKEITPEKREAISTFLDKIYTLVDDNAPEGYEQLLEQIEEAMIYADNDGVILVKEECREKKSCNERAELMSWWHSHARAGTTK